MKEQIRPEKLNRVIAVMKQKYSDVISMLPKDDWRNIASKPKGIQDGVFFLAWEISKGFDAVDEITSETILSGETPVQKISESNMEFYKNVALEIKDDITWLIAASLGMEEFFESGVSSHPNLEPSSELFRFFSFAVDRCDIDMLEQEYDICSEENYLDAQKVLNSSIFRPDRWLVNLEELKPIFTHDTVKRYPPLVRIRIKEIYHSYIVAHYISVLALSRSVLEYSLLDRSSQIGIQAYHKTAGSKGVKKGNAMKLGDLVNSTADKLPELEIDLRTVKRLGDRILHPREGYRLKEFPKVLPIDALKVIGSLGAVVERLYLKP